MNRSKLQNIMAWIVAVLLALAFLGAGLPKVLGEQGWIDRFAGWGYADWFRPVVGVVEVSGALALLIPGFARYGVALLALIMLGAGYTHLAAAEGLEILRPLIFLAFLAFVGWTRWPGSPRGNRGEPTR